MRTGRRPESPDLQAAKGNPGKRRTKVERQIERANEIAALMAATPSESGDLLAPPALLTDPRCAAALTVWREIAPKLAQRNIMLDTDRQTVAMYCVYMAEFYAAHDDIERRGYSMMVATVSGDKMPRTNPSVDRRDTASKFVLELSKRLGLTPIDRYNLSSLQRTVLANAGGIGAVPVGPRQDADAGQPRPLPARPFESMGGGQLDAFDSAPPDRQH